MSEKKENDTAKLAKYRAARIAQWPTELENALGRLHKSAWRLMTKLRVIELLTRNLPPHLESTVDTCRSIEILDVIRNLAAESIHEIDLDDSDVITKLLIDLENEKQLQKETPFPARRVKR